MTQTNRTFSRGFATCVLFVVGVVLVAAANPIVRAPAARLGVPCSSPDSKTASRIQRLKVTVADTDSGAYFFRESTGLTGVDSGSIVVVTDTVVCTRATAAIDSSADSVASDTAYVVVRGGPRFIGIHPTDSAKTLFFLDTNFVFLFVVPQ